MTATAATAAAASATNDAHVVTSAVPAGATPLQVTPAGRAPQRRLRSGGKAASPQTAATLVRAVALVFAIKRQTGCAQGLARLVRRNAPLTERTSHFYY